MLNDIIPLYPTSLLLDISDNPIFLGNLCNGITVTKFCSITQLTQTRPCCATICFSSRSDILSRVHTIYLSFLFPRYCDYLFHFTLQLPQHVSDKQLLIIKDYYKLLEVDYDATDEKIRLNYRKLALVSGRSLSFSF